MDKIIKHVMGVPTGQDGNGRIVDGNNGGNTVVGLGAFEYQIDYPYSIYHPLILK